MKSFNADEAISLMKGTNDKGKSLSTDKSYWGCFQGRQFVEDGDRLHGLDDSNSLRLAPDGVCDLLLQRGWIKRGEFF